MGKGMEIGHYKPKGGSEGPGSDDIPNVADRGIG
jgi:hypothetical protein